MIYYCNHVFHSYFRSVTNKGGDIYLWEDLKGAELIVVHRFFVASDCPNETHRNK